MSKILIFGNSGSGKSTLAKELSLSRNLEHLDLDSLAWKAVSPPERLAITESHKEILNFTKKNKSWVIEGSYSDLLELLIKQANEIIYLDLPVELCILNARSRPWEPHKYPTKKAQDRNLEMLINWIADYPNRSDTFSKKAHKKLFDMFTGKKRIYNSNDRTE